MNITKEHIASKKRVGTLDEKPVHEVVTTGGLHLIVTAKGGDGFETLGVGPHRAISRHLADKRSQSRIKWTDLSKSDHVELADMAYLLPHWEQVTERVRKLSEEG